MRWIRAPRSENDRGGGIEELAPMVLAYSKYVQTHLIGVFDLFDQVAHPIRRADGEAGLVERRCEAIDADLHLWPSPLPRLGGGCDRRVATGEQVHRSADGADGEDGHFERGRPDAGDPQHSVE
jgi:hypothetical protein